MIAHFALRSRKHLHTFIGALITGFIIVSLEVCSPSPADIPKLGAVPAFSLLNEDSNKVSLNDLKGKVSIVDFVFTSCAGTCPMMSTKMAELQQELLSDEAVQFVSVSVDPEVDIPRILANYGKGYGAVKGKWWFITGERDSIYQLTKEGFKLGLDIEGDEAIIHSQKFVLVDRDGMIRGYYDSEDEASMKQLVEDARDLGSEVAA